ncbi:UNKNOWN [Stylonychia lemnae]|uniref:Uncharacterized protein n=1 Tax=Stylonychia lemnae TaxID=5949 RepID=A0A078A125_STYLE|nr:UNKNOWN [Stylonychia lemnae]|eukprot:CDW74479.1 UNKNOWN [Stylonychia lemnae]
MLTSGLFAGYSFGVGAIVYNLCRTKLQNDFEQELRNLREYDFQNETIPLKELPVKCMILAKYDPEQNKDLQFQNAKQSEPDEQKSQLLFSRVLSCSNVVDPAKYFTQHQLQIQLQGRVNFFDLDTITTATEYKNKTLQDRIKEFYYRNLRKLDFNYIEKGIIANKENELLVAGQLDFDKRNNRLVIRKPNLIIGSDRLEFYEFLGRRREVFGLQNRNWVKFCVGITAVHFIFVRVPTLFSSYFGDEVGVVSEKLGAEDLSELTRRQYLAKQQAKKEL